MAGEGAAATAREWITQLPPGTWFKAYAVPGSSDATRMLLTRLLREPVPIIGRAARGVYWRQRPPRDPLYGRQPWPSEALWSVVSPPGSGYASLNAVHRVGWATQVPVTTLIAVPWRNVSPSVPQRWETPRFVFNANLRRRDLNWNEATLLEAAMEGPPVVEHPSVKPNPWWYRLERLLSPGWMVSGSDIRKEALLWAAETERPKRGSAALKACLQQKFEATMAQLESDLPPVVLAP